MYPLSQHIGAPAVPRGRKRRTCAGRTRRSQEAGGFVSAPIHASVSGTVKRD
ncbi:MAG: hypothetical protein ACLR6B_01445 [Blautia sp.]